LIDQPGIYDLPALDYHGDPCPSPSLSRSAAVTLLDASPAHAYAQHPRLGGKPPTELRSGGEGMDIGTAVHAAFLEGGAARIEHCPFDDWRTTAAKEMRDASLAAGRIPLKTSAYEGAMRSIEALEAWRKRSGLFTAGKPEQSVIWEEDGLWCRARVDWLPDDAELPLLDLKTTGGLATPRTWGRNAWEHGLDIQASMYPRGVEFVRGEPPDGVLFVVVETSAPFAVRVFGLDPVGVEVGHARAEAARAVWRQCLAEQARLLAEGRSPVPAWPGYPSEIEWIFPPPWIVQQWEVTRAGGIGRAALDPALIERMVKAGNMGG